jgi:TRIAD3 protein (E3 ubiquitin-protein ligase RNF216)
MVFEPLKLQPLIVHLSGAHFVRCMDSECTAGQLSLATLQTILPGKMLQLFTRRMQREELRAANLGDIDSCPFCDFAMIIDNENERLFKCLNPECLRESCR